MRRALSDAPGTLWPRGSRRPVGLAASGAASTFGDTVTELNADAVIDMVNFALESAVPLVKSLRGRTGHLVHCGSVWMHGLSVRAPILEEDSLPPFGEYGIQKAAIARALRDETESGGLLTTSRSHHVWIAKAQALLGYQPQHAPEDAAPAGVDWMLAEGVI